MAALAVATAIGGYALATWFPESALQLGIGTLLLIFGLQWLRKAILRSAGLKALHDEEEIFRAEQRAAQQAAADERLGLDWFAFIVSFKGVFLEGLEVVFIVITFGLNADSDPGLAAAGAVAAAVIVLADRRRRSPAAVAGCPRTRSSMASACCSRPSARSGRSRGSGVFAAERRSARVAGRRSRAAGRAGGLVACLAYLSVTLLRRTRAGRRRGEFLMRFVRAFGRFWWDFIVGDEWRIAAGVSPCLALGALATSRAWASESAIVVGVAIGIAAVAVVSIVLPARRATARAADE